MAKAALAPKLAPRKQRVVDIDESLWRKLKVACVMKNMTVIDAIEEALFEWLAE